MNNNNKKETILTYLEKAYSEAELMKDEEMICRLTRAIIAFDCDELKRLPSWEEMREAYRNK